MNKIKTISFDLGGVLFTEGKKVAQDVLFRKYGYDKELILKVLKSTKSIELRKGLIEDKEFWLWVQNELPKNYDTKIIKKEWYEGYILDEDIFNLVKKLKNKYKLVVFSGNIKSRIEYLDRKYHFRQYFDAEIYSYDYHFNKPDKEFFEILIRKSGNKPNEIVHIDNSEKIVSLAKELGIKVLIYQTGSIKELEKGLSNLGVKW